jgi:hypothetical protein
MSGGARRGTDGPPEQQWAKVQWQWAGLSLTMAPLQGQASHINIVRMKMKTVFLLMLFCSAHALASDCVTNRYGKVVCSNGQKAVKVNPNTGTAATAQKNANGVTTTKSSRGGEAKTKNGKGVYESPTGTKCVKTARQQGCT